MRFKFPLGGTKGPSYRLSFWIAWFSHNRRPLVSPWGKRMSITSCPNTPAARDTNNRRPSSSPTTPPPQGRYVSSSSRQFMQPNTAQIALALQPPSTVVTQTTSALVPNVPQVHFWIFTRREGSKLGAGSLLKGICAVSALFMIAGPPVKTLLGMMRISLSVLCRSASSNRWVSLGYLAMHLSLKAVLSLECSS